MVGRIQLWCGAVEDINFSNAIAAAVWRMMRAVGGALTGLPSVERLNEVHRLARLSARGEASTCSEGDWIELMLLLGAIPLTSPLAPHATLLQERIAKRFGYEDELRQIRSA